MQVIAVVQLDRLVDRFERQGSDSLRLKLSKQLNQLRQCQSINHWVFTAELDVTEHTSPQVQSLLGIKLITSLKGDPLDEFYHAATMPRIESKSIAAPLVLRIIPGAIEPSPLTIDAMVENHIDKGLDYSRSEHADDGNKLFIELMNFNCLQEAWREALLPDDRELITPYIYRQKERLAVDTFSLERAH